MSRESRAHEEAVRLTSEYNQLIGQLLNAGDPPPDRVSEVKAITDAWDAKNNEILEDLSLSGAQKSERLNKVAAEANDQLRLLL